jgi:hypothetical protein
MRPSDMPAKLVVACFTSDSLPPPNGGRVGVRGKYLKIKSIYCLVLIFDLNLFDLNRDPVSLIKITITNSD